MAVYRRREKSDTWHFGCTCLKGRKRSDIVMRLPRRQRPSGGELCNIAKAREARRLEKPISLPTGRIRRQR